MTLSLLNRNVRVSIEVLTDTNTKTLVFEGLQVEFNIERTLEKEPSTCTLSVYNLAQATRDALQQEANRKTVTVEAGYGDDMQAIFVGDITSVIHLQDGPDFITEIEAGDGDRASRNWVRANFAPGVPLATVVRHLIKAAGLRAPAKLNQTLQTYEAKGTPTRFQNGIVLHGYAVDELYEILNGRGIRFSIQDNKVQLLAYDGAIPRSSTLHLTSTSGLVGAPSLRVRTVGGENSKKKREVLEATTLLVPGIMPGAEVYVEGANIKGGIFRIDRATFRGSVFGSEFAIDIEGSRVS